MARWFAGAVIYRDNENVERELLVMDCKSLHEKYKGRPMQVKFPGGTEEEHPEDNNVLDTLRREIVEETDLSLKDGAPMRLVHSETPNPAHFKSFYLIPIEDCEGSLRTEEKTMGYDWMSAPYWVKADELGRTLYRSHQTALIKVLQRFGA
ncbi:MAG: NUDIX hydrolase [bacterium]|nr:NUDIX hydrolase [bacterium]